MNWLPAKLNATAEWLAEMTRLHNNSMGQLQMNSADQDARSGIN